MSRDFFQYIRQMNLSVRNISAQIISGPSCGTRALWQADTLVNSFLTFAGLKSLISDATLYFVKLYLTHQN